MDTLQKKIQHLLNLFKSKKLSKAELFGKELTSTYPNNVILYNILGLILTYQKKIDEAIECYEKGIKIKPDFAMIYNNLGSIYKSKENYTKAENYYKKSIDLDRKIPETQNNLGNLYISLNKYQKAIACYKNALNINPKFFTCHYNIGVAYKNIGKFEKAKKYLQEAVKLNKHFYIAHRTLSQITKYTIDNEHFNFLKKLYEGTKIIDTNKKEIAFALGKASEDIKDFSNAFKYYNEGNYLHRKSIIFSIKNEKNEFNNIKKTFNEKLFNKFKQSGDLHSTAIFIIGMPRSGSTLVEQILSNHPKVFGGDELIFLGNLIKKHFDNKASGLFLKNIINIDEENLKKIGHEYISNLRNISDNSERVTDKFLINFKWIGLIKLILPNSKIVHCVRNPRDNCLSIFKNYFTSNKLNFSYNLEEIAEFYNLYSDLMEYWKNMLPKYFFDIKYEKLIQNPKQQIRNLLKECNLTWHDNCLKFYNNKRPIKTASDTQARKKIYKSSVDSWKNYEKDLKKFFKILPN